MKKYLFLSAAIALCVISCKEPDPEPGPGPGPEGSGYLEKTFEVNVEFTDGVNTDYGAGVANIPGQEILEFLGLSVEEFHQGMGSIEGSSDEGTTSQVGQNAIPVMFGVAEGNNTDNLNWVPQTSSNYGHWFTMEGRLTTWGDALSGDAFFYTESTYGEWGADVVESYDGIWEYQYGMRPDVYQSSGAKVGDLYKFTEVFFVTDDEDVERYAYVQWNVSIKEAEEIVLDVIDTEEVNVEVPFNNADGSYPHTELDLAKAVAALGAPSIDDCVVYGVNADGSYTPGPGTNFWFDVAGNVSGWGEGAGICINKDNGWWGWCMYPDEALGGQTCHGAIAITYGDKAYVYKFSVTIPGIDYLSIDVLVPYESGDCVYVLNENNIAALSEALGVDSVAAAEIGSTYALKAVQADGSIYDGDFTANNGYWFDRSGNVTDWAGVEAAGYVGEFIEYRGDYQFGCGFWEESGETATVKVAVGDAVLTFNLTVAEPAVFETEEIGVVELTATQTIATGYTGQVVNIDEVLAILGIDAANFNDSFVILDVEGGMEYTSNGGFWYDAAGVVTSWGNGQAFFFEPSYGEGEVFAGLATGIEPSAVTEATTFKATFRAANVATMKHVTCNLTLSVTAE